MSTENDATRVRQRPYWKDTLDRSEAVSELNLDHIRVLITDLDGLPGTRTYREMAAAKAIRVLVAEVGRLRATVNRVNELLAADPDTSIRTTWRDEPGGPTECWEVPANEILRALDGEETDHA